ncbi:MAG: response regulator transcription factor [Leptolyngbyaceae cyanobacterium RU_5_1]|nr:response regulator transcription factor [Leptolyngbyaceae cyanobacterium RU_5_1]
MTEQPDSQRIQILLVEDDPMMRVGLKHLLAAQPQLAIVGMAEDGYLGVEAAATLQPDVVVMDVGMPHLDGIAATQQIKQTLPGIKVIMLTSHTDATEVLAALSSGADGYCVKGTSVEQLVKAIEVVYQGATYLDAQIAQCVIHQIKPANTGKPAPSKAAPEIAPGTLSERELEVLRLIVEGYSNPEIAKSLYLSEHTVKTYVRGIMNKLLVNDRVQAAVLALRSGLMS